MDSAQSPTIRPATFADAESIAKIYAPYVTDTAISFEEKSPSAEEMASRMGAYPWLVAEQGGEVVGFAYASAHRARSCYRWSVDVSVYLRRESHGQGIGRSLYARLFELLASQGFVNAYAGITLPNPASVGLHESFGFRPVGVYEQVGFKFGKWHDVGWWQKQLRERTADPGEPS